MIFFHPLSLSLFLFLFLYVFLSFSRAWLGFLSCRERIFHARKRSRGRFSVPIICTARTSRGGFREISWIALRLVVTRFIGYLIGPTEKCRGTRLYRIFSKGFVRGIHQACVRERFNWTRGGRAGSRVKVVKKNVQQGDLRSRVSLTSESYPTLGELCVRSECETVFHSDHGERTFCHFYALWVFTFLAERNTWIFFDPLPR